MSDNFADFAPTSDLITSSQDLQTESPETRWAREVSNVYDAGTLIGIYEIQRARFCDGVDCPIMPVLCIDKNDMFALCLINITYPTRYLMMSKLDMDDNVDGVNEIKTSPNGAATGVFKSYGITLSGKTKRRFRWGAHRRIINRKIILPANDVRAGRVDVKVRMMVDGVEWVQTCPVVKLWCTREQMFDYNC